MWRTASNRSLRFGFALVGVCLVAFPSIALGQCEFQKLTALDAEAGDVFGSVAISGDYLIVGASGDDDACPLDPDCKSGAAYIFHRDDNGTPVDGGDDTWIEQAKLTASDAEAGDRFGSRVDIDGDLAIVSAPNDDDACPLDPNCNSGAAYVFRREGTNWVQEAKLTADDAAQGDLFGLGLSLRSKRAAIGAPLANGGSGSAYVFRLDGSIWKQEAELTPSDAPITNRFGEAISIAADLVAVGAPNVFDSFFNQPGGAVYVFRRNATTWVEEHKLTPNDSIDGDLFGEALSLNENRVLVGTKWREPLPSGFRTEMSILSGSAHIFRRDGTTWTQEARIRPSDGGFDFDTGISDDFGVSVSLNGDTALVGSFLHDSAGTDAGAAYVFMRSGNIWTEKGKLIGTDTTDGDLFGAFVALSETYGVVDAGFDDDACPADPACNSGSVFVYWLLAAPDCTPIPAVGAWGLVVLLLLIAVAGSLLIRRRYSNVFPHILVLFIFLPVVAIRPALAVDLAPRSPAAKPEYITTPSYQSYLVVKFIDNLKARIVNDALVSLTVSDLSAVLAVQTNHDLTFKPLINLPQDVLDKLEGEAAARSGRDQPDLGGMMRVEGAASVLETAANELLALDEVEWVHFVEIDPQLPCVDILDPTPDFFTPVFQGYHFANNPDGGMNMTYAWTQNARGLGIQVVDVEKGYLVDHEDLCGIINGPDMTCLQSEFHGTSVLGELVAIDNDYGCTGLVPDAVAYFFPTNVRNELNICVADHITATASAIAAVSPGDVVLIERAASGAPVEVVMSTFDVVCNATCNDKIVVEPAGNGNKNLDSSEFTSYRSRGRLSHP